MRKTAPEASERVNLLTAREVATLVKVDKSTIYRMAEDGRLPAVKVGRQWRFPEDQLLEWLTRRPGPGGASVAPGSPPGLPIDPQAGRALSDLLGDLLGVMVVLTDMSGRPLAEPGNPCGLFSAAHQHPGVLEQCISGWRAMADELDLEPRWQATPLGFLCARSLVRVGDQLRGMVLAGGVAPVRWPPDSARARQLAAGLGLPFDYLAPHLDEVHRLTLQEQERVLRLLPRVAALLSRLAGNGGPGDSRPQGLRPATDEQPQRSGK